MTQAADTVQERASRSAPDAPTQAVGDVLVVFGITGDLARVMTFRSLYRLEARGLIEALPPEDRRRPYRLTGLGATTLKAQLEGLQGFARTGLRRLEGSGTS